MRRTKLIPTTYFSQLHSPQAVTISQGGGGVRVGKNYSVYELFEKVSIQVVGIGS